MALDRTNMVSLLDIGLLTGQTSSIVEMGDGFTELTEDWAPNTESTQYVNMKSASSTMKGYAFSMSPEREYLSDDMQKAIDKLSKTFPTGSKCETYYYRFYKTDITGDTTQTGECIKVPVIVAFSGVGGAGGDILTSTIQINGNGDAVLGTISISSTGEYTWAEKE